MEKPVGVVRWMCRKRVESRVCVVKVRVARVRAMALWRKGLV